MEKDTVCRVEERKSLRNIPVIDFLNQVFNPFEKIEKQYAAHDLKIDEICYKLDQIIRLF
jgi:hypothetical protein